MPPLNTSSDTGTLRRLLRLLGRERLIWFVLIGALIFALQRLLANPVGFEIDIDTAVLEQLRAQWRAQRQQPLSAEKLDGLVRAWVREEILVREARRLGLHQGDTIVRRRLAQKMDFLLLDRERTTASAVTENELRAWYQARLDQFTSAARISFRHIFFRDRRAALELLPRLLPDSDWRVLGEPFMLPRQYDLQAQTEIAARFGTTFVTALLDAPQGQWHGPLVSDYGLHLVWVEVLQPARTSDFASVRDQVALARRQDSAHKAVERAWQRLRARYQVKREAP